jgi:hypothetical protein
MTKAYNSFVETNFWYLIVKVSQSPSYKPQFLTGEYCPEIYYKREEIELDPKIIYNFFFTKDLGMKPPIPRNVRGPESVRE